MTPKIDITKQYRTRSGKEVKLFTTEARGTNYPVRGEYRKGETWSQTSWDHGGRYCTADDNSDLDLVEVPPIFERVMWVHKSGEVHPIAYFAQESVAKSYGYRKVLLREVREDT